MPISKLGRKGFIPSYILQEQRGRSFSRNLEAGTETKTMRVLPASCLVLSSRLCVSAIGVSHGGCIKWSNLTAVQTVCALVSDGSLEILVLLSAKGSPQWQRVNEESARGASSRRRQ